MPHLKELIHFDGQLYRLVVGNEVYSDSMLRNNIFRKRRTISATRTSIQISIRLAFMSLGISAISIPLSARRLYIARKKLSILEAEWSQRGHDAIPVRAFKDRFLPSLISAAISFATCGLDAGIASAGADAVHLAARDGAEQLARDIHSQGISTTIGHDFVQGIEDGVQQAVALAGPSDHITAVSSCAPPAFAIGQEAGVKIVENVADKVIEKGGKSLGEKIAA